MQGNPKDPANVFRYDKVTLNLLGSKDYNPSMPWAHKLRLSDGRIAADPLMFVDDARPNGPTEEECWKATRNFASMCSHFGIQDAPRKRRPPSLDAGAWAGLVVHTDGGEVGARAFQSKWDKTRVHCLQNGDQRTGDLLCAQRIGRSPRRNQPKAHGVRQGLLKLCDSSLPSAGSLFEGIHLTVDGWRPDRNDQGANRGPAEERSP